MGSPRREGSKKLVLKFLSIKSIVIAPANIGRDSRSSITVTRMEMQKRLTFLPFIAHGLIVRMVLIKLMAPRMEESPARWRLNIVKSTFFRLWPRRSERGGYKVHPAPTRSSNIKAFSRAIKDGGRSQKLTLLSLGKAISGQPK